MNHGEHREHGEEERRGIWAALRDLRVLRGATLLLSCVLASAPASAQNYPLLEELNRQTQSLYTDVQGGVVRVQLPVPKWVREVAAKDDPLSKWDNVVAPDVRKKLVERRERQFRGQAGKLDAVIVPAGATTRPTTRPTTSVSTAAGNAEVPAGWKVTQTASGETILESTGAGDASIVIRGDGGRGAESQPNPFGGPLQSPAPAGDFVANNLGLIIDDEGHVLVPLYVERETLEETPVRVMVQDREVTAAFVGSDEKTNLTVLKLMKLGVGRAVKLAHDRPTNGSMVMMLDPAGGKGRMALWTGSDKEYGVVVGMDGTVAGVARYGQFLGGAACRGVVDQLIKQGKIERAVLGTRLTEIASNDSRRWRTALGERPALLVEQVVEDSRAHRAGLRAGDFIVQMGEHAVGDLTTWAALTARGGKMKVTALRGDQRVECEIDLQPEE